ncbi:unnamed protein product [Alopecurus aequalis]
MGEEVVNRVEEPKVEAEPKKEESPPPPAEEGKKKEEEPPADAPPSPPPPVILGVEVHCTGCAKRMRRSLLRSKGVEAVHVDMAANQITAKGVAVDPEVLCRRLRSKTKREVTIISPLPPPPPPAAPAEEAAAPPPPPAEDPVRTVELLVNMHCDACALQLQKKMLKMKGVQTAETDLAAGKLTVTGTVEGEAIVEYIHRRTGKLATVVPPPEPPKEEAPPPAEADQKPADDKKEEDEKKPAAEAEQAAGEEKKEAPAGGDEKPGKQEGEEGVAVDGFPPEEMMKRMVYWPYGGAHHSYKLHPADAEEAMMARRMAMHAMPPPPPPHYHHHHHPYAMTHHQWMPPPPPPPPQPMYYGNSYMMERPPQMFSDENPNACVIS